MFTPVLLDYLANKQLPDIVVVSPDVGGVARARLLRKKLDDAPLLLINVVMLTMWQKC